MIFCVLHKKCYGFILYVIIFLLAVFFLLPFLLFGTNSVITIHDNLDSVVPWLKMYHDNGLFLKFDTPTKGLSEMSTLYYGNYSFLALLYCIFGDFAAYTINTYIYIFLGFFSMYLLLKKIGKIDAVITILVSLCYAILPVAPNLGICVSALPLIIVVFFHFINYQKFSWKILLILFYPFFSSFAMTGIFILGFWLIGFVYIMVKTKKINLNLLIGFIMLCIGYIIVDLRLFYVMFVLKTPLNRSVFNIHPTGIIAQLKVFMNSFKEYSLHGYYHASSFQRKIIVPFAFIVSVIYLLKMIRKIINQSGEYNRESKTINESSIHEKMLFIIEFTLLLFSVIAALYDSGLMDNFFKRYIPALSGFNWGRVWIFNRVLWYVIFALCLQFVLEINGIIKKINFSKNSEYFIVPLFLKLVVWILVCKQLLYIFLTPTYYNDQIKTWVNEVRNKRGLVLRIIPNGDFDPFISYKDFFAVDLFDKIKKDIVYSDERVVAFGYEPSVLMYNGFNCIDGYNSSYPLSYMRKFRTLIAPELEINQWAREYYDIWGGGCTCTILN